MELITGWKFGKGPCGNTCTEKSVDTVTNNYRDIKEGTSGSINCFGNFSSKYHEGGLQTRDLNPMVHQNYTERVIAVNEHAQWEQEFMTFSIEMIKEEEDIVYEICVNLHIILKHAR